MVLHHIRILFRAFRRNKTTFFINLIGLSTGLACVLLIALWVSNEYQVNRFFKDDERRYQILENAQYSGGITTQSATPDLLADELALETPEVEYATAVTPSSWFGYFSLSTDTKNFKAVGQFAGKDFFHVFPYELLQGTPNQVLAGRNSIVLSEALAKNLFGSTENVVGKQVGWRILGLDYRAVITGIFKDVPANSTERFDFVLSFDTWKAVCDRIGRAMNWDNHGPSTYVLLRSNADPARFSGAIAGFVKARLPNSNVTLLAQLYADRYLLGTYTNGVQSGGRIEYVKLFSLIAIFILLIACINFMNLATAKASTRMKEVGIRKSVGASRRSIAFQFLTESVATALLSSIIAVILAELFMPEFNVITGGHMTVNADFREALGLVVIVLCTGVLAGSYPAFYLSKFNSTSVLKGEFRGSVGELWARKGLVVFQFTLSIVLIVGVLVVERQMRFIQEKNLGYNKDNVVYFDREGSAAEHLDAFLTELRSIPGVVNASVAGQNLVGIMSSTAGVNWEGKKPQESVNFIAENADYNLLETLGIQMEAGRPFSRVYGSDSSAIIFNQAAIDVMGLKDPVGKNVTLWGVQRSIIGVTRDFNFESLHEPVKPLFFILDPRRTTVVNVRVQAGAVGETLDRMKKFYASFNPGFAFDWKFLDQSYQALYESDQRVASLSRYFAAMAVIISCLGLFGLATFAAERRLKEVGIRKVLGASVAQVVYLLSKDLAVSVLISNVIAWPVAYYFMSGWLHSFAYRESLGIALFFFAGGATLLIACATMGFQAIRAATQNPVISLRYE